MKARFIGKNKIFKSLISTNMIFDVLYIKDDICYIKVENDTVGLKSSLVKLIDDKDYKTKKFKLLNEFGEICSQEGIVYNDTHIKTLSGTTFNRLTYSIKKTD